MNFDYTLYLVTDRQLMSCDSLTEAVEQAILGGCTMIQLKYVQGVLRKPHNIPLIFWDCKKR